jgi:hypothetical protein
MFESGDQPSCGRGLWRVSHDSPWAWIETAHRRSPSEQYKRRRARRKFDWRSIASQRPHNGRARDDGLLGVAISQTASLLLALASECHLGPDS